MAFQGGAFQAGGAFQTTLTERLYRVYLSVKQRFLMALSLYPSKDTNVSVSDNGSTLSR